jgi:hypothetical protein
MKMVEIRAKHGGYPKRFRMCTAKNSNNRIFEITKILADADMNKGATLSFQSMDDKTLSIVKRKNIKITEFSRLMDRYKKEGIATYTELILGMPGESYESTKDGMNTLINGQEDSINIYVYTCTALPNSEMSDPAYVEKYGIKLERMPILLSHSTPELDSLIEYNNVVVETASMSREDWRRTYMLCWAIQGLHCLGLTQYIAILFRKYFGLKYSDFYEKFVEYFTANRDTLIGGEVALTWNMVRGGQNGGRFDRVLPQFGSIYWPLEEAAFLNLVVQKGRFYKEVRDFLDVLVYDSGLDIGKVDPFLFDDIVLYESARIIGPQLPPPSTKLRYNLHEYLNGSMRLENRPTNIDIRAEVGFDGDFERYAREVVWYGRKGGKFHHPIVVMESV